MDDLVETTIAGKHFLISPDADELDILKLKLSVAMETEISALEHVMTFKRRQETHNFILECYDRLKVSLREGRCPKQFPTCMQEPR